MKTVIFNGSPRPKGDTTALIRALSAALPATPKVIDAYRADIRPCMDCRRCWDKVGCVIRDGMEEIYRDIMDADCIVIASPVYFSTLTGPLLSLMSRLQMFYTAGRMQGVHLIEKNKVGGILLCGGGNGSPACAEEVARGLLRTMHTKSLGTVCTHRTDDLPAAEDGEILVQAEALGQALIRAYEEKKGI